MVAVQLSVDNGAKDHLVESTSDQNVRDPDEMCNTANETEKGGNSKGGPLNLEDKTINDVGVNCALSATTEERRENNKCASMNISGQPERGEACKIKQEEHDDENDCNGDDDDIGGIISGFLEDSDDDLLDNNDHYNVELMPAYTSDHESRVRNLQ